MNKFGGNWTESKIEILVEYAHAYLVIMNKYADKYNWKLLYFDGFAGSGFIIKGDDDNQKVIIGAAKRILEIKDPRSFDEYYFVEKDSNNVEKLKQSIQQKQNNKKIYIANEDCNVKILSMTEYLKSPKGKNRKVLAYIDPFGMQLKWSSLKAMQELDIDVWVLVPTGLGVNRLLKTNGNISDAWIERLELFLGMSKDEILDYFYNTQVVRTLFGDEVVVTKEEKAIEKSAELYNKRLNDLFKYVTKPYIIRNSTHSIMFHFFMASNNKTAVKIANQIIDKYNSKI